MFQLLVVLQLRFQPQTSTPFSSCVWTGHSLLLFCCFTFHFLFFCLLVAEQQPAGFWQHLYNRLSLHAQLWTSLFIIHFTSDVQSENIVTGWLSVDVWPCWHWDLLLFHLHCLKINKNIKNRNVGKRHESKFFFQWFPCRHSCYSSSLNPVLNFKVDLWQMLTC